MSVRPSTQSAGVSLNGIEGTLVSVNITVDARDLENLLEALAQLEYPINPQIYHQAMAVYRYADGTEKRRRTTVVDFPAYASWGEPVRRTLRVHGFDPANVHVSEMLDELHEECAFRPAPEGASYSAVRLIKHAALTVFA
jgi:hypothetical protein